MAATNGTNAPGAVTHDPRQFFRQYSGLRPIGFQSAGEGWCACQPIKRVPLFRKGGSAQCDICVCLRQPYEVAEKKPNRLGLGSYLFIAPDSVRFWGNHAMNHHNPAIECETSAGKMMPLFRSLIKTPPQPPWMFIGFSAATSAHTLAITTDLSVVRFSGDLVINRAVIREVNRQQVMALVELNLSRTEWDQYLDAYYSDSVDGIETMRALERDHPMLRDVRRLPPKDSAEHTVLRALLAAPVSRETSDAV